MTESKIKFVGLHAHSCFSVFDGLGYPNEHMDFAHENGMDALALTDHGNMNGLSYQVLHAKKMKEQGKVFKPIYGVEAYFHPSIKQWVKDKEEIDAKKKSRKKEEVTLTVEDESASKQEEKDIIKKRSHLILLAQNQKGLNNIFKLISNSYKGDNYYRYPRIDYELLENIMKVLLRAALVLGVFTLGIIGRTVKQDLKLFSRKCVKLLKK